MFKHATLFFSRSTPNITSVLPVMDHIDKLLTTYSMGTASAAGARPLSAAIRAASSLSKKTLNRYYEKTDYSELYRVAMGMLYYTVCFTTF
jgi:hypothetical protein